MFCYGNVLWDVGFLGDNWSIKELKNRWEY